MYSATRRAMLCGAALAGVSLLCCAATSLKGCLDNAVSSHVAPASGTVSGGEGASIEGLPAGVELAARPYAIEDGYALFADRVVKLVQPSDDVVEWLATAQAGLFGLVPEGVRTYLVMVPTRATFEKSLQEQGLTRDERTVIDALYGHAPANVTCVDAYGLLDDHRAEYLYFRTSPWWTMRGAYHAARGLVTAAELLNADIDECEADTRVSFWGSYKSLSSVSLPTDKLELYMLRGQSNEATIYKRDDAGDGTFPYSGPVIAVSRGGVDAFLGGTISHAIIKGDGDPGRAIMVYGSPCIRALIPWLIVPFGTIVFVDASWHRLTREQLQELIALYSVTDFAVIQTVEALLTNVEPNRMARLSEGA